MLSCNCERSIVSQWGSVWNLSLFQHTILESTKINMRIITYNNLHFTLVTLITWRKRWAPNNASKQQMGFNSAFKVLNRILSICLVSTLRSWLVSQESINRCGAVVDSSNVIKFTSWSTCNNCSNVSTVYWPSLRRTYMRYVFSITQWTLIRW